MFGGKQLHEIGYEELATFLEEKREEGVRLDYKERWTDRIIETACAFANTYGGYLLYGIKEVQQRNRPNQPDPDDIPGVDFSKGDPAASLRSRILDNTRPPVELEIRSVPLKGSKDRGALIARIDESPAAPHEVLLPGATRIPVRRADTTVAASLDEIERLVQRRDALLSEGARTIDLEFFRELLGGPKDGFGQQRIRPVVGMMTQPRRIGGLNFVFDSRLDRKIREMALQNEVNDVVQKKAMPSGLVLEDAERGTPDVRVEIHNNGMIRGARALYVESSSRIESSGGEERAVEDKQLDFMEIASSLCAMVRFAANVYALKRPGVEMEVWFGLADCQGHKTTIPVQTPFRSYSGQIPGSPFYQQPVLQGAIVKTGWEDGCPSSEDLLALVRGVSRFFQISAPDERLRDYL